MSAPKPVVLCILDGWGIRAEAAGNIVVPAIQDSDGFNLRNNNFCAGNGCADNQLTELMREISSHPVVEDTMEASVRENQVIMVESLAQVQEAGENYVTIAYVLEYSISRLGRGLRLASQLLMAGVSLVVSSIDCNFGLWLFLLVLNSAEP